MGRAQAVQAEAAGIEPAVDMNPILLKPVSEVGSQVIVQGVVRGTMDARTYYREKKRFWKNVTESYDRLVRRYDCVVMEGAGSPVEINLKDNDIVNMAMAEYADARVILVADIERGGVFASILGTVELFEETERERLIGFIINKFRGDPELLQKGITLIEQRTHKPVLGIVPYLKQLYVPGEDSVALTRKNSRWPDIKRAAAVLGVILLPHLSNYTDFDPLEADQRFQVDYLNAPRSLACYDGIILPGSKNVFSDLTYLEESGFRRQLLHYAAAGGKIVGVCGGYQMLGMRVEDPQGVEDCSGVITGLGLLPIYTVMEPPKITKQTAGLFTLPGLTQPVTAQGYEIHMGRTFPQPGSAVAVLRSDDQSTGCNDLGRLDGRIWGTYLHGLFENDYMRTYFLRWLTSAAVTHDQAEFSYHRFKEENYDLLAATIESHVNTNHIMQRLNI